MAGSASPSVAGACGDSVAGNITSLSGLDDVAALPGIDIVRMNRRIGDMLDSRLSRQADHLVRIDGCAPSHEELFRLVHQRITSVPRLEASSE